MEGIAEEAVEKAARRKAEKEPVHHLTSS